MNSIDFGGHRSKVKATMGIIDKCGVRGDATLCVVIFFSYISSFSDRTKSSKLQLCTCSRTSTYPDTS